MDYSVLPAVNASLNALAGSFLLSGFYLIKSKRIPAHRACMITAAVCSLLFFASYITYHLHAGTTRFTHMGWPRILYFTILLTHTPLAVLVLPLAVITLIRALKGDFARHKRLARWTWPIWIYVSVTGVLIYFMLYQWFPPA
jgi:putative membrane protein